jgi:putative membrane protein
MADTPPDNGAESRTGMAAERTWLAWWRTSLGATAGALAIGRFAPEVLHTSSAPYIALGCGYAALAVALLIVGARRQRDLQRATEGNHVAPLSYAIVVAFTIGGIALAVTTVVLVVARG